jgi:hypothetical protein
MFEIEGLLARAEGEPTSALPARQYQVIHRTLPPSIRTGLMVRGHPDQ